MKLSMLNLFVCIPYFLMLISVCVYETNLPVHCSENSITKKFIVLPVDVIYDQPRAMRYCKRKMDYRHVPYTANLVDELSTILSSCSQFGIFLITVCK